MTIKGRIVMTMAAALMAALVIGLGGLTALGQTQHALEDIYKSALVPIVHVTDVRGDLAEERARLSAAVFERTPEALQRAQTYVPALQAKVDQAWSAYYPALVNSESERTAAQAFITARQSADDRITALLATMRRDDSQAIAQFTTDVDPALAQSTARISAIVAANEQEAETGYQASVEREQRTLWAVLGVLVTAIVVVAALAFALARAVVRPLLRARALAQAISRGELDHRLVETGNDELSHTLRALGTMDEQLASIVGQVRQSAHQVSQAARDVSAGTDDLASRTQEQASSLEEMAAAMEEMTATVRENASGAQRARTLSATLEVNAEAGQRVAQETERAMAQITRSSHAVEEIAGLIDELAFQTNLLALNAAVEAARAGAEGRGFAVVATEVRHLAQRSAAAARDIKALIQDASASVEAGATLVGQTGDALQTIVAGATEVSAILADIAAASTQQAAGIDQVNDAVTTLDEVTQQNAALVEEASAATRQMRELADALLEAMTFFRSHETSATPTTLASPATRSSDQGTSADTPLAA